jgi:transposase
MQEIPVQKRGILPYAGDDGGAFGQAYRLRFDVEAQCCYDGRQAHTARNNDLAHLAANILILLATVWQAELIAGESLKSLRSTGHGRSAKGRWMRWRNNSQIRGELWRCLRYKCHLVGLRLVWQYPKGTTHTCPHCGKPVKTYTDPSLDSKPQDSGAWLRCFACGWNGARDYAAAINIALLGVTFLKQNHEPRRADHPTMTEKTLKCLNSLLPGLLASLSWSQNTPADLAFSSLFMRRRN